MNSIRENRSELSKITNLLKLLLNGQNILIELTKKNSFYQIRNYQKIIKF